MSTITDELTSRDVAFFVWLAIFAVFALARRDVRQSLKPVLHLLLFSRLTVGVVAMVAYVSLVIFGGYKLGTWQPWMLKDTLYWFFGSAVTTFFGVNRASSDGHFFRRTVLDNLRFAAVLAFVINLYVFNLVVELLLLPSVTLLAMLLVVAGSKPEFAQVKTLLQWLSGIVGLAILAHAVMALVSDPGSFATLKNAQDLLLPLVLTTLFLPFIYVVALYMLYELLYVRLKILNLNLHGDMQLTRYTMWQVVRACRLRLGRLQQFSGDFAVNARAAESKAEVIAMVKAYRAGKPAHRA